MSCQRDAAHCNQMAGQHGAPEAVAMWSAGRGAGGHCARCGGFLDAAGACHNPRCGTFSLTTREEENIKEGASLAKFLRDSGIDPLNNEGVRRLHQNYVSIVTGTERAVILDTSTGTAATDMRGKVYLNPYPLGKEGAIIDQLIITQEYIDHELGHKLFTPVNLLDATISISRNTPSFSPRGTGAARWRQIWQAAADLSPAERELVHSMVNVVEDARMERVVEQREPYMWQQMAAGQLLQPKDGHARNGGMRGLSDHEQVLWATQIIGQSNYALTDDIQAGMSERALDALRDLMPVIDRGVRGNAYDALASAIEIVREIKRRGMLDGGAALTRDVPDGFTGSRGANEDAEAGDDSPQAGGKQGGGEAGGRGTEKCTQCGAFLNEDGHCNNCGGTGKKGGGEAGGKQGSDEAGGRGKSGGSGSGTTDDLKGPGAPTSDNRDDSLAPLHTKTERHRLEKERRASRKLLDEMRDIMTGQYKKAVKKLITNAEKYLAKNIAAAAGNPPRTITLPLVNDKGIMVSHPYKLFPHSVLMRDRARQSGLVEANSEIMNRGAAKMASRLKKMKQRVQRNAYIQKRGALDRRRMVAAVKGSDRIRMQQAARNDMSMAVTMSFDISGSMSPYREHLGTIAGMIGRGLEKARVPYEFRAYSVDQYHIKAFEHKKISNEQVGSLYNVLGNNCDAPSITMGGYALQTRTEAAKVQFVLTDGKPQSFVNQSYGKKAMDEVKNAVAANREKGILTLGIFFAGPSKAPKENIKPEFDYMYGEGNWVYVPELEDVPNIVTGTLEKQLARFLPNFG